MNRVLRRTWLSALVLAAMTVFAGCAAETGDPEASSAGQPPAGHAPKDGTGEAVGTAQQADRIYGTNGAWCLEWKIISVGGAGIWCCDEWSRVGNATCGSVCATSACQ